MTPALLLELAHLADVEARAAVRLPDPYDYQHGHAPHGAGFHPDLAVHLTRIAEHARARARVLARRATRPSRGLPLPLATRPKSPVASTLALASTLAPAAPAARKTPRTLPKGTRSR